MEIWELEDLLMNLEAAEEAHRSVAHSCAGFNDWDGDLYHSGMAAAYEQVAESIRSHLAELDSASGRRATS